MTLRVNPLLSAVAFATLAAMPASAEAQKAQLLGSGAEVIARAQEQPHVRPLPVMARRWCVRHSA